MARYGWRCAGQREGGPAGGGERERERAGCVEVGFGRWVFAKLDGLTASAHFTGRPLQLSQNTVP